MVDDSSKPAADAADQKPEDNGAGPAADRGADLETPEDLQAALDAALEEAASLRDAALRAQAETENIRRRATRDVEKAHQFALERFAGDLLGVADSLEKAVESASTAVDVPALAEGVELSLKLFLDTLRRHGIEQVDPLGEPFDPSRQEAMAAVPNPDADPNSVMEVMQKGYLLNGRVVRAAKVIVSKAPETPPAAEAAAAEQAGAKSSAEEPEG